MGREVLDETMAALWVRGVVGIEKHDDGFAWKEKLADCEIEILRLAVRVRVLHDVDSHLSGCVARVGGNLVFGHGRAAIVIVGVVDDNDVGASLSFHPNDCVPDESPIVREVHGNDDGPRVGRNGRGGEVDCATLPRRVHHAEGQG